MNPRTPNRRIGRAAGAVTALVTALGALSACASGPAQSTDGTGTNGPIPVVTSTNVWGSVVSAVGGEHVQVTALIGASGADPHEYESRPADAAAVAEAKLVVVNGGGYDDFATKLVDASGTRPVVLNAVELSGLEPAPAATAAPAEAGGHGEFNEHVWYAIPAVRAVAQQVAAELGTIDPANAATFTANAASFGSELDGLSAALDAVKAAHTGQRIAITEPVPLYLTEAAGLVNVTPEEFSEAVEEGTDPPAAVLAETLALFSGPESVRALVNNTQTESPSTTKVVDAARAAGVPVVDVTETLPEGVTSYVAWQRAQIEALARALTTAP